MKVDYVIPFVDGSDPKWLRVYSKYSSMLKRASRSRDWDTLRYQLRSIETFMPWINNIYIILSIGDSQIPKWLNMGNEKIKIVWDWEIVPERHIPTFNSNVIDLYIPRIEGLSEHFLYACDDYIITKPRQESDFFTDNGEIKLDVRTYRFKRSIYSMSVFNSVKLLNPNGVTQAVIDNKTYYYCLWSNHTVVPHIKSKDVLFLAEHEQEIERSLSMFRTISNLTWLIYPLNMQSKGLLLPSDIKIKRTTLRYLEDIDKISFKNFDVVVINDGYIDNDWLEAKKELVTKMQNFLPTESSFEVPLDEP